MTDLQKRLFKMQDLKYRDFHSKLMPNVPYDAVIGVRVPELRKFSKEFAKTEESRAFIKQLPHKYYEENNVHAFVLEQIRDYDTAIMETEKFLPYIDNWATCDMFLPKAFKRNTDKLILKINEWIKSDDTYTVRYAIGLLLKLYLDEGFRAEYLQAVAAVRSDEYYVNMMIAWYFATALAKQYDVTISYIVEKRIDTRTHNKAIQKAIESNRISKETKEYLKGFKIK